MRNLFFYVVILIGLSCKPPQGNDDKFDPAKTYQLKLNPASGSSYAYEVKNENSSVLEIDDKEIKNESSTETQLQCHFDRDSIGNLLLTAAYKKIRLYSKNGDQVTEAEASDEVTPFSATQKILSFLREGKITVTLDEKGQVINMRGYEEVGNKIAAAMDPNDLAGQRAAKEQWERSFGDALVKKNLDQLFKIFPDSVVAIGDEWKLTSKQGGDFPIVVTGMYKLKTINEKIAIIGATGKISSGADQVVVPGGGKASIVLTGEQESEFEMEKETGMLIACRIKTNIEGVLQMMGREIPIKIKTTTTIKGKKL